MSFNPRDVQPLHNTSPSCRNRGISGFCNSVKKKKINKPTNLGRENTAYQYYMRNTPLLTTETEKHLGVSCGQATIEGSSRASRGGRMSCLLPVKDHPWASERQGNSQVQQRWLDVTVVLSLKLPAKLTAFGVLTYVHLLGQRVRGLYFCCCFCFLPLKWDSVVQW